MLPLNSVDDRLHKNYIRVRKKHDYSLQFYIETINRGTMYNRNNKLIAMHLSMWVHAVHFRRNYDKRVAD